jgi:ubiquinone/menaquinone biosynthesis C-methylase UbiE
VTHPIPRGLDEGQARRFYDKLGKRLSWGEPFEGRAKALAFSWVEAQPGQRVLEVGVGTGDFFASLAERGVLDEVLGVGLDVSSTMLRLTDERAPGARLVRGSACAPPFAPGSFDWIYLGYTLDLFPLERVVPTLRALRELLAPEGHALICSLTEGRTVLERLSMGTWKLIHRALGPAAVGGCRPLVLSPLLEEAGFEVLRRQHVGQLGTPSEVLLAR